MTDPVCGDLLRAAIDTPYESAILRLCQRSTRLPNGCLVWDGCRLKSPRNYGRIWVNEPPRMWLVHRMVQTVLTGPVPEHLDVCHRCDNSPCFEPSHLFTGTRSDNMLDCSDKGRLPMQVNPSILCGERHGKAVLTEQIVKEIRYDFRDIRPSQLAKRYGVSPTLISYVRARKGWKHVP